MVKKINPDPNNTSDAPVRGLSAVGDKLLFRATDADHGSELWRSDGSAAGTVLVKDIEPGTDTSEPAQITPVGSSGAAIFVADASTSGREIWFTDGTEAGTTLAVDTNPGPGSADPRQLVRVGDEVYFTAGNPSLGTELWRATYRAADPEPTPTPEPSATASPVPTATSGPTPTPGTAPPTADRTAPALTGVKVKVRKGRASFSFRLSEAAKVQVRLRRGKKRSGTRSGDLKPGKGTLRTKRLKAGRYTAALTATDAAGNASAPKRVAFRVRAKQRR